MLGVPYLPLLPALNTISRCHMILLPITDLLYCDCRSEILSIPTSQSWCSSRHAGVNSQLSRRQSQKACPAARFDLSDTDLCSFPREDSQPLSSIPAPITRARADGCGAVFCTQIDEARLGFASSFVDICPLGAPRQLERQDSTKTETHPTSEEGARRYLPASVYGVILSLSDDIVVEGCHCSPGQ